MALCRFGTTRNTTRRHANHTGSVTPPLATAAFSPEEDRTELERWADGCQLFSPLVGLEEAPYPSALLMDVTGSAPRLGGEQKLLEQLFAFCERRGYRVQAAIASTVGAAWACSHYLDCLPKTGDRAAASFIDPPPAARSGHTNVWSPALATLPVAALRIDADVCATLETLGIVRLDQLLALPRSGLRTRFGDGLLRRLDQAGGRVPEPIEVYVAPRPWKFNTCWNIRLDKATS